MKYAVKYNKQNIIDHFIKEGVSICDDILEEATKSGNINTVKYLLTKSKRDVRNLPNILPNVAYSGNKELFMYLTEHYSVEMQNPKCLVKAAEGGNQEMVDFLLDDLQLLALGYKVHGLYGALRGGHMRLVNYFLSLGTQLSYESYLCAIEGGHKEAIDIHKQRFPYISVQFRHEIILEAITYKHHNIVESFLINQLINDPNTRAEYLSLSIQSGDLKMIEYFTSKGIRLRTYHRRHAIESDNIDVIKYTYNILNPILIEMNNRAEIDGFNGIWSPMIYSHDLQIVDYFLVDIKKCDKEWLDYIMSHAVDKGKIYLIKYLLEKGFDNWTLLAAKLYNMEQWRQTNNPAYTYITECITTQQAYIDKIRPLTQQTIEQTIEQSAEQSAEQNNRQNSRQNDNLETFKSYLNEHVNKWHKKISRFTLFSIASIGCLVYAKVFIRN